MNIFNNVVNKNKPIKTAIGFLFTLFLIFICTHVFAEDLLKGTETNLIDTINGTGKKYLYIAEFITACLAWFYSKTAKAFFGVLILSVGANIILKIGGII